MPDSVIQNHMAYVQSWGEQIRKNPSVIFDAIKDAQAISDYMNEKGELEALKLEFSIEAEIPQIVSYQTLEDGKYEVSFSIAGQELNAPLLVEQTEEGINRIWFEYTGSTGKTSERELSDEELSDFLEYASIEIKPEMVAEMSSQLNSGKEERADHQIESEISRPSGGRIEIEPEPEQTYAYDNEEYNPIASYTETDLGSTQKEPEMNS